MVEDNHEVLDVLEEPLVALVSRENAPMFDGLADSPLPKARSIGAQVLEKYFEPESMARFFTMLGKETEPENAQVLTDLITKRAKDDKAFGDLFVGHLPSRNERVQLAAVGGLNAIKNPKHFAPVFTQYLAEDTQKTAFEPVLKNLASEQDLPQLYAAIQSHPAEWAQEEALTLIHELPDAQSVGPLFDYLEKRPKKYTDAKRQSTRQLEGLAIAAIERATTKPNHAMLLDKLGSTNVDARRAALKGIVKLNQPADVPRVFQALVTEKDPELVKALGAAVVGLTDASQAAFLLTQVKDEKIGLTHKIPVAQALGKLKNTTHVEPLFAVLQTHLPQSSSFGFVEALDGAIKASLGTKNVDAMLGHLESVKADAKAITYVAGYLHTLASPKSVTPLMTILDTTPYGESKDATGALQHAVQASVDESSKITMMEKLTSSRKVPVRQAAAMALKKLALLETLPTLITAFDKESDKAISETLSQAVQTIGAKSGALGLLTEALGKTVQEPTRLLGIPVMAGHGQAALDSLFEVLGKIPPAQSQAQAAGKQAIFKLTDNDKVIDLLSTRANDKNLLVNAVATEALNKRLQHWGQHNSYDDPETLASLNTLMQHRNKQVSVQAGQSKGALVQKKVRELDQLGRASVENDSTFANAKKKLEASQKAHDQEVKKSATENLKELRDRRIEHQRAEAVKLAAASVRSSSSFGSAERSLEALRASAEDPLVIAAVASALSELQSRRRRQIAEDEAEERRQAEQRRQEQARRDEESRSRSNDSGGGGFGGGFSSGGGGEV